MNITEAFIEGLIEKSNEIPPQVTEQAKKCLLDYTGVLIGGKKYVREVHLELFDAFEDAVPYRSLVNGFCAHALELDDGHRHGMIHLGASIVTAVLEAAKETTFTYEGFLCGIVMGYEVAVRCARAIQPGHKVRGYHVSGTCGTIGSAMGVAFACGYNMPQMKSTLACAVSSAAGVLEIQEEASEMKPYNVGRAAMDGLVAAQMGRLALPGPDDILGGKRGFFAALTDTPHPEMLTDFTNEDYAIEGIYQKVHAACRHCHPAIDATLDLRNDLRFELEDVGRIEVHTYKLAVGSHDHIDIKGICSAKLSTPFAVALALVKGSAGYADYKDENLADYWIKNLTRKVKVIEDEELTQRSPVVRGAKVTIYLKNGDVFEAPCLYPKGEPENPLTKEELEDKFKGLALYGGWTEEKCNSVISSIWDETFTIETLNS